jgi:hypothetical protein
VQNDPVNSFDTDGKYKVSLVNGYVVANRFTTTAANWWNKAEQIPGYGGLAFIAGRAAINDPSFRPGLGDYVMQAVGFGSAAVLKSVPSALESAASAVINGVFSGAGFVGCLYNSNSEVERDQQIFNSALLTMVNVGGKKYPLAIAVAPELTKYNTEIGLGCQSTAGYIMRPTDGSEISMSPALINALINAGRIKATPDAAKTYFESKLYEISSSIGENK